MLLIKNKKAYHNFEILEKFRAGISLFGFEVKSLKAQQGSFGDSFIGFKNGEAYLKNFYIPSYQAKNTPESYDKYRDRKLLLTKKEIKKLEEENKKKGITLIPIEFQLVEKGLIKLEFAIASGLKKYDKREKLKEKTDKRKMDRIKKEINR